MRDPVCDMRVTESSDFHVTYENQKFFFCSEICMDKFTQNPMKYSSKDCCGHYDTVQSPESKPK
ncbi:MAG: YHS domain-containing protein [Proteobacteria bacterium]|nr:YHS domain-containing protein [Pseudomonadota bacterium]